MTEQKKQAVPKSDEGTALKQQVDQLTEQLKRSQADFINYKNRVERDREQFALMTYADVLRTILPVLDTLRLAVTHLPDSLKNDEWAKGVTHTITQFEDTIARLGVTAIPTVGEKYDANLHEVVTAGPGERDSITEELERGYIFRDTVIRHAKVRVGDGTQE